MDFSASCALSSRDAERRSHLDCKVSSSPMIVLAMSSRLRCSFYCQTRTPRTTRKAERERRKHIHHGAKVALDDRHSYLTTIYFSAIAIRCRCRSLALWATGHTSKLTPRDRMPPRRRLRGESGLSRSSHARGTHGRCGHSLRPPLTYINLPRRLLARSFPKIISKVRGFEFFSPVKLGLPLLDDGSGFLELGFEHLRLSPSLVPLFHKRRYRGSQLALKLPDQHALCFAVERDTRREWARARGSVVCFMTRGKTRERYLSRGIYTAHRFSIAQRNTGLFFRFTLLESGLVFPCAK